MDIRTGSMKHSRSSDAASIHTKAIVKEPFDTHLRPTPLQGNTMASGDLFSQMALSDKLSVRRGRVLSCVQA